MEELKPCPFCGGKDISIINHTAMGYWASCGPCGAIGPTRQTEEEAVEAWNRRYEPPNEPLTLDELREMDGKTVWVECEKSYGRVISDGTKVSVSTPDAFYTRPENYVMYCPRPEEGQAK